MGSSNDKITNQKQLNNKINFNNKSKNTSPKNLYIDGGTNPLYK